MKHTKGPWIVDRNTVYALNEAGTNRMCLHLHPGHLPGYDNENIQAANAKLIAAAPELLTACFEALNYMDDDGYEPIRSDLQNAITKAIG